MTAATTAEQWQEVLKQAGYESPASGPRALKRLRSYTRIWRRLHRLLSLDARATLFEFGCGGGAQIVPLAFHGHPVAGIDVSKEVLERCRAYVAVAENHAGKELPIELYCGDFLQFDHHARYDVVFNFGVIEHLLDSEERLLALRKMFDLAKPGGHILSVVPSGMHPLRQLQRAEGLGGYFIPEIDYSDTAAADEMIRAGAVAARVYPANLFGHLLLRRGEGATLRLARRLAYYPAQLVPAVRCRWAFRKAGTLIIIGQKA